MSIHCLCSVGVQSQRLFHSWSRFCSGFQCSKLDIGRADAGAGGMSIRSGMGASSSSSDASSMAQSTGSGSMCLAKSSSREWSDAALRGGGSTVRRELLLHDGHRALAAVDAGRVQRRIHACSSLLWFSTLSNVAVNCRIVVTVMAQPLSDVTW